jgi:hypothetical protein
MKATLLALTTGLLLTLVGSASAGGNPWFRPIPQAPDVCNTPGSYCTHPCGMWYGPNKYLRPCGLPFNGLLPAPAQCVPGFPSAMPAAGPGGPLNSPVFPTHPYVRSPRDYFMVGCD